MSKSEVFLDNYVTNTRHELEDGVALVSKFKGVVSYRVSKEDIENYCGWDNLETVWQELEEKCKVSWLIASLYLLENHKSSFILKEGEVLEIRAKNGVMGAHLKVGDEDKFITCGSNLWEIVGEIEEVFSLNTKVKTQ